MQEVWVADRKVTLPAAEVEVVPGVLWGRADMLDTAAYWAIRCNIVSDPLEGFLSEGGSLIEEVGFCLLGGYGITAELNDAAFERLQSAGVFDLDNGVSEEEILALLTTPLLVGRGFRRYRFPRQRARRISDMLETLRDVDASALTLSDLRRVLMSVNGIGPKTAAWIIRNHFDSDEVAIIDVHLIRACRKLGLFPERFSLPRDYSDLEARFLEFAVAISVRPAVLDAVIWTEMRESSQSGVLRSIN